MSKRATFFRDAKGHIVIVQFPNWPIFVIVGLSLLQYVGNPLFNLYSPWAIKILMLYWSYLEIRFGVNGFRKVLGVLVAIYILAGMIGI